MLLPRETREHLAVVFNIPRSGITEIRDDVVVLDGRTMDDLSAITVEAMEAYVGSPASFGRLWELSIAKSKHELHPPTIVIMGKGEILVDKNVPAEVVLPEPKRRGRPKKNA